MPQNMRVGAQGHLTGVFLPTDLPVLVKFIATFSKSTFKTSPAQVHRMGALAGHPNPRQLLPVAALKHSGVTLKKKKKRDLGDI